MAPENAIIGPNGTQIYSDGRHTIVRFNETDVVKVGYMDIRLDRGCSRSVLVQSKMNQASRLFDLDYHVIRKKGTWLLQTSQGVYPFEDGMHLLRSLDRDHEVVLYHLNP
jgi:hypothetical protein